MLYLLCFTSVFLSEVKKISSTYQLQYNIFTMIITIHTNYNKYQTITAMITVNADIINTNSLNILRPAIDLLVSSAIALLHLNEGKVHLAQEPQETHTTVSISLFDIQH